MLNRLTSVKQMNEQPPSDELLTTEQAAEILGVSRQAVVWFIHHKGLPAIRTGKRIGGRWVLRRADVEEYRRKREGEG